MSVSKTSVPKMDLDKTSYCDQDVLSTDITPEACSHSFPYSTSTPFGIKPCAELLKAEPSVTFELLNAELSVTFGSGID